MPPIKVILTVLLLFATVNTVKADIAIITSPENPVQALSEKEVQKIFLGRLRMFPQSDLETQTIDLPDNNPLFIHFYKQIANMTPSKLKRYRAYYLFSGKGRVPLQLESESDVIQQVLKDTSTIGYVDANRTSDKVKIVYILKE